MREGWTYKKLGEVCETTSGGTPLKTHKEYYEGGTIPWLRSGEVAQGSIYNTELYITELGLNNSSAKILPINTVVIAMYGATVGQVGTLKQEMATNQAVCGILPNSYFNPQFLMYFLKSKRPKFLMEAAGGAQANISQSIIKNTYIPIIPHHLQKSIVSELDKINELISLKKSQLKDLDALAQSVFYEMFGDPITNEKGWEVKKVIDVVKLQRGFDLPVQKRLISGDIPIYGSNGIVGFHTVSKASYGIITGRSGSIGEVFMSDKPFWPLNTSLFSVDCHGNNILYLKFLIQSYHLERFKQGAGVPTLNRNSFHSNDIIDVPLSLQQSFANKIEAIEEQKSRINQSLKDLETLLQSRMDYWFND